MCYDMPLGKEMLLLGESTASASLQYMGEPESSEVLKEHRER